MDVFNLALKNPLPPARKDEKSPGVKVEKSPSAVRAASPREPSSGESSNESHLNGNGHDKSTERNEEDDDQYRKRKSSRRKHRNSHLGCGTCKKRRIKCDENLPQCFNCVKGKLHCAYLNLDAPARNALRMAQYNQNLRQDGAKDKKDEKKEVIIPNQIHPNPLPPQLPPQQVNAVPAAAVPPNGQYPPAFVPYHIVSHGPKGQDSVPVALPQMIPQQPPPGTTATLIQSPYGPMVLFQPIGSVAGAVAYPPMSVQVMPQVPVVYQTEDQARMPPMGPQYPVPGTASMSNLPPTKNHSYTEINQAMAPFPPPQSISPPGSVPVPVASDSQPMAVPPPPMPLSDPARFSALASNPTPKQENEPVKLPEIQPGAVSGGQSTTQSTYASAVTSHSHSKAQLAASSLATSPVLQGDKVPSILKLLS